MPLQDHIFIVNSFTYDHQGNLLFTPIYSDTVYRFTSASVVSPKYVICQEKSIWKRYDEKLSWQEVTKLIKENKYTRYGAHFFDTDNYAHFGITHRIDENGMGHYFVSGTKEPMYAWDIKNWMDGREIIHLPRAVYNNTFFASFTPQISEENRKNLNPKIKSLLDNSDDGDNPIVVSFTLK